ncbi:glycosyltransferase family 2 protein [Psychrobacter sp. NG254]|uniref:glycosyltransferase family 2 protein n=1 Tax=Psychrobacter sp. NG254 TaxID=2782003 RepID=UPI00188903A0|nr:glycosyltransferase family A protein [Psychrobacter sp. NG254]MBF2718974.1 glycosyltransferase family 2 protein [Psychrobacter sp. NG254]
MGKLLEEFEYYVQTQNYSRADSLIEGLLDTNIVSRLERKEALSLLYRVGYVYPDLTLKLCNQRNDVPRPFIDTLQMTLGYTPSLRFYNHADSLISIKIAIMRNKPLLAKLLCYRFYRQYNLQPINLVQNNKLTIGNNRKKVKKNHNKQKVSIIVTTYNSGEFVENCINSLLNQSISNIEIIVVDDASTDDTVEILKKYPSIKVIKLSNNRGTYHARNIGIEQSSGVFLTFQDSDDWSHPERVERQLLQLTKNPDNIANFSNFFRVDENTGLPSCRQNYPLLRLNISSMMIRKVTLEELGGFNDKRRIESDKALLNTIISTYGPCSVEYIKIPLAIGLLRGNSLTTSENSGFDRYGYSKNRTLT